MAIKWELEGNTKNGDNITLATGTKAQCNKAFQNMTDEQIQPFYFIALQPYSNSERLDFDDTLYHN